MQRELAAELAKQTGLKVMSFRESDCLLFSHGEILKMFSPISHPVLMGTPKDRRVAGEILLAFEEDLRPLRPPSKRFELSDFIVAADIGNFDGLTLHSRLVDGSVCPKFIERIGKLLDALPSDRSGWEKTFGGDSLTVPYLDRLEEVVRYLRETVKFHHPLRDDIQISVSITDPPWLEH